MNPIRNIARTIYHRYIKVELPIEAIEPTLSTPITPSNDSSAVMDNVENPNPIFPSNDSGAVMTNEEKPNPIMPSNDASAVIAEEKPGPIFPGFEEYPQPDIDLERERVIVERIMASYRKMIADQKAAPAPYQPGSKWAPEIENRRAAYLKALRTDNIADLTQLFRHFYRNDGSFSLIKYRSYQQLMTPSEVQNQWVEDFYGKIRLDFDAWKEYAEDRNPDQLTIPLVGNPYGCVIDGRLITAAACPHNYYYQRINSLAGDKVEPVIAEIGAGFGGVAYFLLNSGRKFHYIDFDLPEVLIMAEYFLLTALPDKSFLLYGEQTNNDLTDEVIKKYDGILMPNYQMATLPDNGVDVFVNTHSLSEMGRETVEEYIAQITRTCNQFFYHENSEINVELGYGNQEVTASTFPISKDKFTRIYKLNAIWREPRYREYLYMRKP